MGPCYGLITAVLALSLGFVYSDSIPVASGVDSTAPESLQQQLCVQDVNSNTILSLEAGDHIIDAERSCVLSDLRNVSIISRGNARIVCTFALIKGHNFIFLNISDLHFENVEFVGCGSTLPSDLPHYVNSSLTIIGEKQKVAVLASRVTNLRLVSVVFSQSFGFSILVTDVRGETDFFNVTITDTDNYRHPNCHGNETDMSCSGAGAAFIYSDSDLDEPTLNITSLNLSNCIIIRNTNFVPLNLFIPIFINVRSSYERQNVLLTGGSGLSFYLTQRSYNVRVSLESCNISNNYGYSSAVVITSHDSLINNMFDFNNCIMESNRGVGLARGGAIVALIITYLSEIASLQSYSGTFEMFSIRDSSFINNSAPIGGSMYFFISPQNLSTIAITFDTVSFVDNYAEVGSAFEVNTRQATFKQKGITVLMKDVIATNNIFATTRNDTAPSSNIVENSGAFVFTGVFNITVFGTSHTQKSLFARNSPGAFLILGGNIYLKGYIEFLENRALRGGAISLYDYALLFFHEGTKVNFTRNSAIEVGGAIYANSLGTGTAPTCVFQVIGPNRIFDSREVAFLNLQLRFMNNSANQGGNSIYVNPLYNCAYLPESSLVDTSVYYNASIVYNSIFNFEDSIGNGLRELSSIPERLCYCSDGDTKSSSSDCEKIVNATISVYPGQEFTVSAFPTDLNFNPVSAVIFAELKTKDHMLQTGQDTQQLSGVNCTKMKFNVFGAKNTHTSLALYTRLGGTRLNLDIYLLDCPPGFLPSNDNKNCVCDSYVENVIGSVCNFENYTISRQSNMWLGVIKHVNASDVVYVPTCPTGFCQPNISSVDLTETDKLCIEGRTGILCGSCKGNLSVVFGSPFCMKCTNFWLFTIFLYIAAGIILVAMLFALELTVTHGTLTTVIFYANIVGVNSNILFPESDRGVLFIWVSIMNLELGFPLCFYDGMNEAAKSGLQAIFPTYLLFICLTIILLSEKSTRVAKWTSSHGIQVLATTVYLSFSKMLRYIIDILTYANLFSEERNHHIWFYDGNLEYFRSNHGIIAIIPALLTLLFIVAFTLAMLFIKQIEQRSSKLKPFWDAYGGPFEDKYRYWFGLRLVILTVLCLSFAVLGSNSPVLALTIQLLILCLFMVLQAVVWPYRKAVINWADLIFMINFFVMILFIIENHQSTSQDGYRERNLRIIVSIFVGLAFFHFICIIFWYILKAFYRIRVIKQQLKPYVDKLRTMTIPDVRLKFQRIRQMQKTLSMVEESAGNVKLTSMISGSQENSERTNSNKVSSTELSLGDADNADTTEKMLTRKVTYSHYRESMIDD